MVGRQKADIANTLHMWQIFFWLSMGYNFGCMIASDTLLDFSGWVFGVNLSGEDIAEIECVRVVAMATNCGTKIPINWLCVNDNE